MKEQFSVKLFYIVNLHSPDGKNKPFLYIAECWPYNKPDRWDKRVTYCVQLHPPLALTDPLKVEDSKLCRVVINHFISRTSARQTTQEGRVFHYLYTVK